MVLKTHNSMMINNQQTILKQIISDFYPKSMTRIFYFSIFFLKLNISNMNSYPKLQIVLNLHSITFSSVFCF